MYKSALSDNGYICAEFHLNPTQVGMPNDRPRYYCCAVKNTKRSNSAESVASKQLMDMFQNYGSTDSISVPSASHVLTSIPSLGVLEPGSPDLASALPTISSYLDKDLPPLANDASSINTERLDKLQVSKKTIEKSAAWCFDIVTLDDARSACFTSSYGKFIKGAGSVLYYGSDNSIAKDSSVDDAQSKAGGQAADTFRLVDPKERTYDARWWAERLAGDAPPLRYLSGEEVARLMGFPLKENTTGSAESTFSFPEWCTEKQKRRLIGNSINVAVSARIAELGIRTMLTSKKSDEGCKQHTT
jgi:tRNA (cytosine38-C5)-methyltransferase